MRRPTNWAPPQLAALLAVLAVLATASADLGRGWTCASGRWSRIREVIPMIRQGSETGTSVAFCKELSGTHGAWRATVEPALGAAEAGLWAQGTADLKAGLLVTLGGNPAIGGFALKTADGEVLWEDRFAPWRVYEPYVVEAVIERGRVRAQLFEWDGKTLVSQSPWVKVAARTTETAGMVGLYTRDGLARFWGWQRSAEALSPLVADAPNLRRLVQDEASPWRIIGPGNWMWTTAEKRRLRQGAVVERSSALSRQMRGALRQWECRVKVDPGAGGAGLLFQADEELSRGFIAWLGGNFGAGSLMLYRMPGEALWSGAQDNWHYSTEYVIRAETRGDEARAVLLQADGKTVIQDSGWVKVGLEDAAREGETGFMTWLGTAEFWGFSEQTAGGLAAAPPAVALGGGWVTSGDGAWSWADDGHARLVQTGSPKQAIALDAGLSGTTGAWRCRVKLQAATTAAGLVFQASQNLREGFAAVLTAGGFRLEDLGGKVRWQDKAWRPKPGAEYVVEGEVMTDRVAVRLFAEDGKTLLLECPAVYVPEANNHRAGCLGLLVRGGPAEFADWGLK
jgi:hypothetical protein